MRTALLGAGRSKDGSLITTLIDRFAYPRLGPGMMWERCRDVLAGQGTPTLPGIRIERIHHRNGRVDHVAGRTRLNEAVEFEVDECISSMPLREFVLALDPPPPSEVLEAARRLRYRDYLTVVLIVNEAEVFPDNWIYVHSPEVTMGRIQNYKNWSPDMVPDPTRTALGLEYFLWEKDDEWRWPQDRLIERGIRECVQLGLLEARAVEDGTVVRMEKAYPVYDQDYHHSVATVRRYMERFVNLQTIGRNGLHRYNNQDHSMLTGIYAARNLVGERHDVWSVNTEMEYHEQDQASAVAAGERLVPRPLAVPNELVATAFARLDSRALGLAVGAVCLIGLFTIGTIALLRADRQLSDALSLLGHYLIGFKPTWRGLGIGLLEVGALGLALGASGAGLWNAGIAAYEALIRRRADSETRRDLLDRV